MTCRDESQSGVLQNALLSPANDFFHGVECVVGKVDAFNCLNQSACGFVVTQFLFDDLRKRLAGLFEARERPVGIHVNSDRLNCHALMMHLRKPVNQDVFSP